MMDDLKNEMTKIGELAKKAAGIIANTDADTKNSWLLAMADALDRNHGPILAANADDMARGREKGMSAAMLDRLELTPERIGAIADALRYVTTLEDPVGHVLSSTERPNGIRIDKVSVPVGVIAIIYESRPNVTSDAAGICIKAGNAVILRGGSEAFESNRTIAEILNQQAMNCGLPAGAVQLLPWTDHAAVNMMLKMDQYIDLVIPRGGERLIRTVMSESTIPVIKHYKGVCHIFVDAECDFDRAVTIVENAKCQRPSACNAVETLLIDRRAAGRFVPQFLDVMKRRGVLLRGCPAFCAMAPEAEQATEDDYYTEYLNLVLTVRIVDGVEMAVDHINRYGSRHSEAILSTIPENVQYFFANVDSSTLYENASTRFTDGGEFGMGAEIGISTDKLHARGPMGADELTSTKFIVRGTGQIRE